ncbi:hypothetical protein [Pseudorhodobacter aquimaris]|uniref:hypothetical protein n=1 Tax=Pseudorhodobacter aquimaris TaxID=687412 RepID=UPI00067DA4FF|nr:hypothetical protein [Pseudorhodobacter aquimaris]
MFKTKLIKTRFRAGIWEGVLTGAGPAPKVKVLHMGLPIPSVTLTAMAKGDWALRAPIPSDALCDGVQTFVIVDALSNENLGHFNIISGDVPGDDIRAEVHLLRAEMDMLKRSFRQHCLNSAG